MWLWRSAVSPVDYSARRAGPREHGLLVDAIQPRYRLVVLLATFTSLRYGEIMGLRRGDFGLGDRKVKIDRAHIQPDTGPMFDGDPKANSGRTVSLPAFLVPEVEAHLAEFVGQVPDAYVFLGPKGARPARSNFHTIWDKARQQAEFRSCIC